jgi:hypothetical protein
LFYCSSAFAQLKKKEIKENKIKSVTETVTVYENGKEITRKDSYTLYNKDADILQNEEYRKDGTLRHREINVYDKKGNKIEETVFDAAPRKDESENSPKTDKNVKRTFKYNANGNKTEELEYDGNGQLLQKKLFSYDNHGNKILEVIYDANGKLNKKIIYIYNSKGLRVEKKEYDGENNLLSVRKYQYEF